MRSLIFVTFLCCGTVSFSADYISRDMLSNSSVTVLPGSVPINYQRELNPHDMTTNVVSKTAGVLGGNSKLTLGLMGGIGALGILGVLSAPVAVVTAAAVGGLALVGAMTDPVNKSYAGQSTSNYGILGTGSAGVYGAAAGNSSKGILDGVFGVTNPLRSDYGLGSIGVSSANRAPVSVNMQMPHVMDVAQVNNFALYDSNYSTSYTGYDSGYSNVYGYNGYSNAYTGYNGYSNAYGTAAPFSAGSSFNLFQPVETTQYYDRRGGENFSNFFERTDNASIVNAQRSTLDDTNNRSLWFPNVHYNWTANVVRPTTYLSQSWEYAGQNNWAQNNASTSFPVFNQTYPQYQYPQYQYPQYQYPQYQYPVQQYPVQQYPVQQVGLPQFPQQQYPVQQYPNQVGLPQFPQQNQYPVQQAEGLPPFPQQQYPIQQSDGLPQFQQTAPYTNIAEPDPFEFQFRASAQYYDVGAGLDYPYGTAYQTTGISGNYAQSFQYDASGRALNLGYQPYPSNAQNTIPAQNYYLTPQTAPGVQPAQAIYPNQVYPNQVYPNQNYMTSGIDPYYSNVPTVTGTVANTQNPVYAEQQHQAQQANQAAILQNQMSVMTGASAPVDSFTSLQMAEEKRRELYNNLLEAMKNGDEENRRRYFEEYQEVSNEIIRLHAE